jgi:hypothetical protein
LRLAVSTPNRPALCERAEHVPLEAHTTGVHLVTPGSHRGRDGCPLVRVERDTPGRGT